MLYYLSLLTKPSLITIKCLNEAAVREIKKFFINCFLCVTWAIHTDINIITKLCKIVFSINLNGSKWNDNTSKPWNFH